jgi:hypothetical protein
LLSVLTTNQKGLVAETAVIHECAKRAIGVSRPLDDERYDLIIDLRPRLYRVQCKLARLMGDVIVCRLYTTRRGREGLINRRYRAGEIDLFAIYCLELEACFLLPAGEFVVLRQAHLRTARSRNNQELGVRWARDYEFGATIDKLSGPIAQLGERVHGMHEAAGSSPAGSTTGEPPVRRLSLSSEPQLFSEP